MQMFYEGTDVTRYVDIVKCVHRDGCGGKCDCAEIELENASAWYRWQPRQDDAIEIHQNGYSTGNLYLNTILPEEGRYRILATSVPAAARRRAHAAYEDMRLVDLITVCAAQCGMDSALYGVDGAITYPYLIRCNESAPGFLNRILMLEGATLKAVNGRMNAISFSYAQALDAGLVIEINADQQSARYIRCESRRLQSITIRTPFAEGGALDTGSSVGEHVIFTEYPAIDNAQAARWARGLLYDRNRKCEELHIETEFNAGFTSMLRIDITGATDAAGKWLISEAEHDLIKGTTTAKLLRCLDTII